MEHNTNMYDDDDDPARAFRRRRQKLEAARCRWEAEQREVLIAAARTLLPDHGLALPIGRIAVQAGLPVATARRLFNSTVDLAATMVHHAWMRLIECTAEGDTAEAMLTRLILEMRTDRALQRIHAALTCGAPLWQRQNIDTAEAGLALAVGIALHDRVPSLARLPADALGQQALALLRVAVLVRPAADARVEARTIAAMLDAAALAAPAPEAHAPAAHALHAAAPDALQADCFASDCFAQHAPGAAPNDAPDRAAPDHAAPDHTPADHARPARPPAVYPFDWSVIRPEMAARCIAAEAATTPRRGKPRPDAAPESDTTDRQPDLPANIAAARPTAYDPGHDPDHDPGHDPGHDTDHGPGAAPPATLLPLWRRAAARAARHRRYQPAARHAAGTTGQSPTPPPAAAAEPPRQASV